MKFGIDWTQPSSVRGAVWLGFSLVGIIGWWMGKDPTGLILLAGGVAGGLGLGTDDKKSLGIDDKVDKITLGLDVLAQVKDK